MDGRFGAALVRLLALALFGVAGGLAGWVIWRVASLAGGC